MSKEMKRILLIEPEAVLAEVTAFRLELHGYAVETVDAIENAFRIATEQEFDMILMDLSLPGSGGQDLLEKLSSDETTSSIPVMVLSADADLDQVQKVVAMGAVDFLVVPFDPEALVDKVTKHVCRVREENPKKKLEAVVT
ncbi:MAG: two-component system response regulator [Planctomycetaceae bacterium]|nr:two-component system response regulator [Planctomycetaceae bacterium]